MQCEKCGCRDLREIREHKMPLKFRGISYLMTKAWYRCRHCGTKTSIMSKEIVGGKIET